MIARARPAGLGGHTLRAEELAGNVERLGADNNNLLAVEQLLGDNAGESTEEVTLAVNDDLQTMLSVSIFHCVSLDDAIPSKPKPGHERPATTTTFPSPVAHAPAPNPKGIPSPTRRNAKTRW